MAAGLIAVSSAAAAIALAAFSEARAEREDT